jgi:AraC family transcriptional regulator
VTTGFVYLRPISIVGVRKKGPYELSWRPAWQQMFAWLDDSGMRREIGCGYGILRDNPKEVEAESCRYDACVELLPGYENMVPAGFTVSRLPVGAYARRRQVGISGLHGAIEALRDAWVPTNSLSIDTKRPFLTIYLDDPEKVTPDKMRVDVCLPVTATGSAGARSAA